MNNYFRWVSDYLENLRTGREGVILRAQRSLPDNNYKSGDEKHLKARLTMWET